MAIVSVSLPEPLLDDLDRVIRERGFAGRSEAVRAALRDFVATHGRERRKLEGPVSATLTLVYPEEETRRLGEIKHDYGDVVKSMLHAHTRDDRCVEVFIVQGAGSRVRGFADRLRTAKGTELVETVLIEPLS